MYSQCKYWIIKQTYWKTTCFFRYSRFSLKINLIFLNCTFNIILLPISLRILKQFMLHFFAPVILQPTCITAKSKTLIIYFSIIPNLHIQEILLIIFTGHSKRFCLKNNFAFELAIFSLFFYHSLHWQNITIYFVTFLFFFFAPFIRQPTCITEKPKTLVDIFQ